MRGPESSSGPLPLIMKKYSLDIIDITLVGSIIALVIIGLCFVAHYLF